MANAVSGITQTQHAAQVQSAQDAQNKPKQTQSQGTNPATPEDTVTISPQGHAASQSQGGQPQKTSGDIAHDEYNQ